MGPNFSQLRHNTRIRRHDFQGISCLEGGAPCNLVICVKSLHMNLCLNEEEVTKVGQCGGI